MLGASQVFEDPSARAFFCQTETKSALSGHGISKKIRSSQYRLVIKNLGPLCCGGRKCSFSLALEREKSMAHSER